MPLPEEEMSPQWIAALLGAHGEILATRATRVGEGTGFVGEVVRLTIEHRGATLADGRELPRSVVVKVPTRDEANRALCERLGLYEREIRFYREIAPQIPIAAPACLFAGRSPSGDPLLVLEDVAGEAIDLGSGCTAEQAKIVLRTIAVLHAAWWDRAADGGLRWIPGGDAPQHAMLRDQLRGALPVFEEGWDGRVSEEGIRVLRAMTESRHDVALATWNRGPNTLVHSDLRLGNLLFTAGAAVRLVDWQTLAKGIGALDVAYFLGSSLEPGVRRAHHEELLAAYHDELERRDVRGYSLASLRDDVRRCFMASAVIAVLTRVATMASGTPAGIAGLDRWIARVFAAMDDVGSADLLSGTT